MAFDSSQYGAAVHDVLALDGDGARPMPLASGAAFEPGLRALTAQGAALFPDAFSPQGALAGLYLYFCGYDDAHRIAQDLATPEGSFWHGILHRQEPDAGNAGYWFRQLGQHALFPVLRDAAERLGYDAQGKWDPFRFIDFCEAARRKPGSKEEELAMSVQLAEWQLLFDYCARPRA